MPNEHEPIQPWKHSHAFGQEQKKSGEGRTIVVIALTGAMMVVEIIAGSVYGSMALLADGLHMASHTAALGINVLAYVFARRHAHDARFSFGTGKINALSGFTGALLLVVFAVVMAWESAVRLLHPVAIAFDQAIAVAIAGLVVNGLSVFILRDDDHDHEHGGHRHDHNLAAAYLHVAADALTSLLAIVALLMAKYLGFTAMDPIMGVVGAILVTRWSIGLFRSTSSVLLDVQAPLEIETAIRRSVESSTDEIHDLHVWCVGPRIYSVIISITSTDPQPIPYYRALLPHHLGVVHATIEVHRPENTISSAIEFSEARPTPVG